MAGQGWLAWNDLLAAVLRAILPLEVRTQVVHFAADDRAPFVERAAMRAADRDALRGTWWKELRADERDERALVERGAERLAEREEPRPLLRAHVGAATSSRKIAKTMVRIMLSQHIDGS